MANKTINQLPPLSFGEELVDNDKFAIQEAGGTTKSASARDIADYVISVFGPSSSNLESVLAEGNNTGAYDIIVDRGQKITTADGSKGLIFGYGAPINTDGLIAFGDIFDPITPPTSGVTNVMSVFNNDLIVNSANHDDDIAITMTFNNGNDFSLELEDNANSINGGIGISNTEMALTFDSLVGNSLIRLRDNGVLTISQLADETQSSTVSIRPSGTFITAYDEINEFESTLSVIPTEIYLDVVGPDTSSYITLTEQYIQTRTTDTTFQSSNTLRLDSPIIYSLNLKKEYTRTVGSNDDVSANVIYVGTNIIGNGKLVDCKFTVFGQNEAENIHLTAELTASFLWDGSTYTQIGVTDIIFKGYNTTDEDVIVAIESDEIAVKCTGSAGMGTYIWTAIAELKSSNQIN